MQKLLFNITRIWTGIHRPYKIAFSLLTVILLTIFVVVIGFFNEPEVDNDTYEIVTFQDNSSCLILDRDRDSVSCNVISNIDEKRNIIFYTNQTLILEDDYSFNPDYVVIRRSAIIQRV